MNRWARVLTIILAISVVACSNHSRDADPGLSDAQISSRLTEIVGSATGQGASSGDKQTLDNMLFGEGWTTAVYYSENGPLGPVQSIVSLTDFSFLGIEGYTAYDFKEAQVVFAFGYQNGATKPTVSLLVSVHPLDRPNKSTRVYTTTVYSFAEDEFTAAFDIGGGKEIILETFDVLPEENIFPGDYDFEPVMQILVSYRYADGSVEPIGKFSNLVGFLSR